MLQFKNLLLLGMLTIFTACGFEPHVGGDQLDTTKGNSQTSPSTTPQSSPISPASTVDGGGTTNDAPVQIATGPISFTPSDLAAWYTGPGSCAPNENQYDVVIKGQDNAQIAFAFNATPTINVRYELSQDPALGGEGRGPLVENGNNTAVEIQSWGVHSLDPTGLMDSMSSGTIRVLSVSSQQLSAYAATQCFLVRVSDRKGLLRKWYRHQTGRER